MVHATDPCLVAVMLLEAGLLVGLVGVGFHLIRIRVNGCCRFCLSLLAAWRVSVLVNLHWISPCWDYVWGALFGYAFLYAVFHLANLIHRIRLRDAQGQWETS